jgi:hypothetical protein
MAAKIPLDHVGAIMAAVLTELRHAGGEAKLKDVLDRVEAKLHLTDIETMDLDRLINLWQQYYEQVRATGKTLLPLVRLYFLAPPEE